MGTPASSHAQGTSPMGDCWWRRKPYGQPQTENGFGVQGSRTGERHSHLSSPGGGTAGGPQHQPTRRPSFSTSPCRQQPREDLWKVSAWFCSHLILICGNKIFCPWNKDTHAPTHKHTCALPSNQDMQLRVLNDNQTPIKTSPQQRWGSIREKKPSLHTACSLELLSRAGSPPQPSMAAAKAGAMGISLIFW